MAASAAARVGAMEISRMSAFMAFCTEFGTLLTSSALQKPRAPSCCSPLGRVEEGRWLRRSECFARPRRPRA